MTVKSPFSSSNNRRDFFPEINCVVADAGYKTPKFVHFFDSFEPSTLFALFKAQREKKSYYQKNEFLYDEYFDCYICPQDQMLAFFQRLLEKGTENTNQSKRMCELSSAKPMYQK